MEKREWPLSWRFKEYPGVASQIVCLDREADRELRAWIRTESPVATRFPGHKVITYDMENTSEEAGVDFLRSLGLDTTEMCSVLYSGPWSGIHLSTGLCIEHFYDVWYPSSDDIWIINDTRTWLVECDHEGCLQFVRLK